MSTHTLASFISRPLGELLSMHRYNGSEEWPGRMTAVWPLVDRLAHGSLPIIARGQLWGSLSAYDVIADVALSRRSRHKWDTYQFGQLLAGRIGTQIYRPLRLGDPLGAALEFFINRGTRRVFIVDDAGHVIGHIDASELLRFVLEHFSAVLADKSVERMMLKGDSGLFCYLGTELTTVLTEFHRYRRASVVMCLRTPLAVLTPTAILKQFDPNRPLEGGTVKSIVPEPSGKLLPPTSLAQLPFVHVMADQGVTSVLPILTEHQTAFVIDPERMKLNDEPTHELGVIGHIDIMWVLRKIFRWLDRSERD